MKQAEPDDPMELRCKSVPGDASFAIRCLIEEFAQIGFDDADLFRLFQDPLYPMLNAILKLEGETYIRALIREVHAECGTLKVKAEVIHTPCEGDDDGEGL